MEMAKEENLYAYAGKILRINLSNGKIWTEPTMKYARQWIGSTGIAVKILYDELRPWVTPYDPANKVIIGAGALIGTTAPGSNEVSASTLSPVTGGWGSGNSDSYFAGHLKYAGYDLVVIEGRAHTPVYLWIQDGHVEIRDASHLWGKTTWETLDMIREEHADPRLHAVSIGPAGENLVRGGCLIQDKGRAMGRCGTGAVLGSKNLKTIVVKGTGAITVADPGRFMETVARFRERFKKANCVEPMNKYGTLWIFPRKNETCGHDYKNFQETYLPAEMAEAVDPRNACEKYTVAKSSFPGCAFGGCGNHLYINDGPYAGLKTESCQWEVMGTLQTRLAVRDPSFMFKANAYCNQLGLDVDMAGGTIGWAMECYQRGIIDEKDTDGLRLEWGDAGVALELMRRISYREGFGDLLAEGCVRASDIMGRNSSYYCHNIKKQELYEACRGSNGWALGVAVSTRGAAHTTGAVAIEGVPNLDVGRQMEVYGVDNADKPLEYEGKAKLVQYMEIVDRIANCLGMCMFQTTYLNIELLGPPELAELYSAATGWKTTKQDFQRMAMQQLNLEKAFNLRFTDFDRKNDMPTPRDLHEPIPTGPLAGWKIDEEKWNKMLDDYYDLHGWDRETSYPKRETLADLGLDYVADELEKIGKLR